mmetsp:Transcript_32200/g.70263  ORF Transcript_32200/g.70263 Transcript_32200/m.70263 type:complete len:258 (+) Transcript_32200:330-1103(+)
MVFALVFSEFLSTSTSPARASTLPQVAERLFSSSSLSPARCWFALLLLLSRPFISSICSDSCSLCSSVMRLFACSISCSCCWIRTSSSSMLFFTLAASRRPFVRSRISSFRASHSCTSTPGMLLWPKPGMSARYTITSPAAPEGCGDTISGQSASPPSGSASVTRSGIGPLPAIALRTAVLTSMASSSLAQGRGLRSALLAGSPVRWRAGSLQSATSAALSSASTSVWISCPISASVEGPHWPVGGAPRISKRNLAS